MQRIILFILFLSATLLELDAQNNPNDSLFYYKYQWGLKKIQAPDAWSITTGDSNMIIGILDSGIPLVNGIVTHEDFNS
jgi:hypothetical protein